MLKNVNLRPQSLKEYLGQEQVKEAISIAIQAASKRGEPLDHVLLNGPPGLGKTTLAQIIAKEMKWKLKTVISTGLSNPRATDRLLRYTAPKTILFIDEVHRLRKNVQETLYPVLEDGKLISGVVEVDLPAMTIMGATTNIGKLEQPFIDRFPLQFQLQYYEPAVLKMILRISATKLHVDILDEGLDQLANRSRGTPRIGNNLLRRIRDYSQVMNAVGFQADAVFVDHILSKKLHIDGKGLRQLDRAYLRILAASPEGVGLDTLAATLREEPDTVEEFTEPFLLQLGFIRRHRTGRWITKAGLAHIRKEKSDGTE